MTEALSAPERVAVVGLGIMGSAFARLLIDSGYTVHGFDPDPATAEKNATTGVAVFPSLNEAVARCDFILTSLPSESALQENVDALAAGVELPNAGVPLIEMSTLSIECKADARYRLEKCGVTMLDCPVSGTGAQAVTGDIVIYGSGDKIAFESCCELFSIIARESFYLGSFGNGMRMKFVANLLVAIHNVATAEAFSFAKHAGLNPQTVYDVIRSGAGTSKIFELRGPIMVDELFEPATMKLDVWQKDMALIEDFARSNFAQTPLFDTTKPLYDAVNVKGLGHLDTAAVIKALDKSIDESNFE